MNQLVLDTTGVNLALPESLKGGYTAQETPLTQDLIMIAGNMVKEERGLAWVVTYQYGYLNDADKDKFISACVKGSREPITCSFLIPDSNQKKWGDFFVTSFTRPKFMWSRLVPGETESTPAPLWGDFSVELREVDPHD